jgi:peptidoglycan hydrolase-like amidase
MTKTKFIIITLFLSFLLTPLIKVQASIADDADAYDKFPLYSKYEKKDKYSDYKKFKKIKTQLGFDDIAKRQAAKDGYAKYKLYKKDPSRYRSFAQFLPQYNAYKKYLKYSDYSKYSKYKKYDNKQYNKYKKYGSRAYEDGYNRYKIFMNDLGNVTANPGPEIRVGLWSKNTDDAQTAPFKLTANKSFVVTNCGGATIGTIPVGSNARVTYVPKSITGINGTLRVYNADSLIPQTDLIDKVCFQAADGNNTDMIFDVDTPSNLSKGIYDHYRGRITIQHSATDDNAALYNDTAFADNDPGANAMRRIWVINTLPLEQYLWGYGEMAGGVEQHSKALIVAARSYARWHKEYGLRWKDYDSTADGNKGEGFDLLAYPQSQIYKGYDYETAYPLIADAARKTNGIFMKYDNEYVLGAYSSNTDGNTRSLAGFPYLVSVPDPYGQIDSPSAGNHMWGMSAAGSLDLAANYSWSWTHILGYYYTGISIAKEY